MPGINVVILNSLIYFMILTLGVTFSIAGLVSKYIAVTFSVDTYVVGYCFTLFSLSYSSAVLVNGWFMEKVAVGHLLRVNCCLAIIALIGMINASDLIVFSTFLLCFGFGMGILLPTAFHLTMLLYDDQARARRAIIVTFFFAIGSILGPILAGLAFSWDISWRGVYSGVIVMLLIVFFGTFNRYLAVFGAKKVRDDEPVTTWNINVYVAGLSVFCYMISEFILNYWIIQYLMARLAMNVILASSCLSVFWGCVTAGRLAGGFILSKISLSNYIIISSVIACAAFVFLQWVSTPCQALTLIALMGLSYSGLYPTLVSFGTFQAQSSPKITSFLLASGSAGGILSFVLSSYLKQTYGVSTVMSAGAIIIGMVPLLTGIIRLRAQTAVK